MCFQNDPCSSLPTHCVAGESVCVTRKHVSAVALTNKRTLWKKTERERASSIYLHTPRALRAASLHVLLEPPLRLALPLRACELSVLAPRHRHRPHRSPGVRRPPHTIPYLREHAARRQHTVETWGLRGSRRSRTDERVLFKTLKRYFNVTPHICICVIRYGHGKISTPHWGENRGVTDTGDSPTGIGG